MTPEQRHEIIHRFHSGHSMRGIGKDLQLSPQTVSRALRQHAADRREGPLSADSPVPSESRTSKLDAHDTKIRNLLERYPKITSKRIMEDIQADGYDGGYSILSERIARLRPRDGKPFTERFETGPGVQAQMDYSLYTLDFTSEGRRRVNLFSYILGYSRRQYLRFVESQDLATTLREHVRAFEHLGGAAATCLYDNMKVVVDRWEDDQPIYNRRFLAFAMHYGFRPVACRPRRPQTKGKVERPFDYVEKSLLAGREFRSLEHLNEVTQWWLAEKADVRTHATTGERPLDRHAEERSSLLALPESAYEVHEVIYRVVDAEGFVACEGNRYSVPWKKTCSCRTARFASTCDALRAPTITAATPGRSSTQRMATVAGSTPCLCPTRTRVASSSWKSVNPPNSWTMSRYLVSDRFSWGGRGSGPSR